jgi:hypothetical protein
MYNASRYFNFRNNEHDVSNKERIRRHKPTEKYLGIYRQDVGCEEC